MTLFGGDISLRIVVIVCAVFESQNMISFCLSPFLKVIVFPVPPLARMVKSCTLSHSEMPNPPKATGSVAFFLGMDMFASALINLSIKFSAPTCSSIFTAGIFSDFCRALATVISALYLPLKLC